MDIPGRIEWWPVILRGTLDAERIQATGLRAYRARSGGLVFAVNWKQGRAYYSDTRIERNVRTGSRITRITRITDHTDHTDHGSRLTACYRSAVAVMIGVLPNVVKAVPR